MYAVETGVPIPRRKQWSQKYPWHDLGVGHSFFVADGNLKSLRASASMQKTRTGHRYLVREVEGGVRVWRSA